MSQPAASSQAATAADSKALLDLVRSNNPNLSAEFKKMRIGLDKEAPGTLLEALQLLGFDTAQDWRKNTPAIAYLLAALPCVEDAQLGRLARLLVASDAALVPECDEAFEAACRKFASSVSLRGPLYAFQAVQPLLVALQKRTSALTELSSVHTDLLQVCVVSRMYTLASRVADVHLTGLARRRDGSKPPRVFAALGAQRYFYYAGVAYAGLRRYEDAARAFMTGISLPAHTLGAVHVASYKKYVLVSLLARGRLDALPRHLGLGVAHSLELLQQSRGQDLFPYMQLARAFEEQVADSLAGLAGEPMFAADGNAGLAEAVLRAYDGARVARLTTVYLTLSLERIAQVARLPGAAEAEVCVLNMVRGKQVSAKIDQRTRSVHFLSADASKELDAELDRLAEFGKQLQDVDKRLAMQKAYVKRLVQRSHQQSDFKEDAGMSVSELAGRGGR